MNADVMMMNIPTFEGGKSPTPLSPRDWPYYQKYFGKCMACNIMYNGPKRSIVCWECLHEKHKNEWINRFTETPSIQ